MSIYFQRLVIVVASIVLFYATYYGNQITSKRIDALQNGKKTKSVITRITSKRSLKTLYVTIDGQEFDAGDPINERELGDTLTVYHKIGVEYVVPLGKKTFISMLIFQYIMFSISVALLLIGIFYPSSKLSKQKK